MEMLKVLSKETYNIALIILMAIYALSLVAALIALWPH